MTICRVEDFYSRIKNVDGLKELKKAAIEELEYLNKNCGTIASLKTTLSAYRGYLKDHFDNKVVSKRKVADYLLGVLKLTNEQYDNYKLDYKEKVRVDNYNLRKIYNVDAYLKTARSLLYSMSYYDKILGLCALTGRRSAEIGCSASFEPLPDDGFLQFSGQLKTKNRGELSSFKIPVLANFYDLHKSLIAIRDVKPVFINQPTKFNKIASKELGIRVRRHLGEYIEGHLKVKDLRAIYATISYDFYLKSCDDGFATMSHNAFFSKILGHHEHDLNTSNSYSDFCIKR